MYTRIVHYFVGHRGIIYCSEEVNGTEELENKYVHPRDFKWLQKNRKEYVCGIRYVYNYKRLYAL